MPDQFGEPPASLSHYGPPLDPATIPCPRWSHHPRISSYPLPPPPPRPAADTSGGAFSFGTWSFCCHIWLQNLVSFSSIKVGTYLYPHFGSFWILETKIMNWLYYTVYFTNLCFSINNHGCVHFFFFDGHTCYRSRWLALDIQRPAQAVLLLWEAHVSSIADGKRKKRKSWKIHLCRIVHMYSTIILQKCRSGRTVDCAEESCIITTIGCYVSSIYPTALHC